MQICVLGVEEGENARCTKLKIIYLPTQGLTHNNLCQPKHSYSCVVSVPLQAHVVLKSVPKIPSIASLHASGGPAHFFVRLSTAQACSYVSKRNLETASNIQ